MRHLLIALAPAIWLLLATACDSKAKATDPAGGARAEQKSKEYESCGASLHCQDDLRCFDTVCRRIKRSVVGDYHAAVGAGARARGEHDTAVARYLDAINEYNREKVPVPPDLECATGAAFAAGRSNDEYARRAAQWLHRCVLAVPAGSSLRQQALANLALLADLGLDPVLLGRTEPADAYLTKGPATPATDKLAVTITASPPVAGKSWPKLQSLGAQLKPQLIDCWVKHNEATKKAELAGSVTLKVGYAANPDYEGEGSWYTKVEPDGADAACVHGQVESAIKQLKLAEKIDSRVTFTIR